MKKFIGILMAFAIAFCNLSLLSVDAKVIQPKLIKTEKWTTYYWIDDNVDMKYPYVAVEADIYDNGELKVYWWNTHEWDGFTTITHKIYIGGSPFIQDNTPMGESNLRLWKDEVSRRTNFDISNYNINTYPKEYQLGYGNSNALAPSYGGYAIELPCLEYSELRPQKSYGSYGCMYCYSTFRPTVEPTGTYTFQIFGHEIVITPDILNMDGYKIEEYHSDTAQYEAEIADLKVKNTTYVAQLAEYEATIDMYETLLTSVSLERGDVNNDGFINAVDASQILAYYAYTSTGGHLDFMDFVEGKADKEEG